MVMLSSGNGGTLPEAGQTHALSAPRGTNQAVMRAQNERLVLTLLRQQGPLAKSDIARIGGLSAQTASVIMRALEQEGLLERCAPVRGRIGQPSVPMALAADGAFFLGLKIGRRSADLVLVDFLGRIRGARRRVHSHPAPDAILAFVAETLPALCELLPEGGRERLSGMGVAIPFQLWNWVQLIGAPQEDMDAWRGRDIASELSEITGLPVQIQNDATSACGAELIFGTGARPANFLYLYFGTLIGGGLVMNGQLLLGRTGNAAGIGPMRVPGPDGQMVPILNVASLSVLAKACDAVGAPSDHIWESPENWNLPESVLRPWIEAAADALAHAILASAALIEIDAVMLDGWMPAELRARLRESTERALSRLDLSGITTPEVREGTIGPDARALGAAAVPLAHRYLLEPASTSTL